MFKRHELEKKGSYQVLVFMLVLLTLLSVYFVFSYGIFALPTQGDPILNATTMYNRTSDNLTAFNISTADADSDGVKNIYNWYLNDESITVLNFPFEGGSLNGTASNAVKDYSPFANNASAYNIVWNSSGGFDNKGHYAFNASNSYIIVPYADSHNLTKQVSVMLWVKNGLFANAATFDFVVTKGNNYYTSTWGIWKKTTAGIFEARINYNGTSDGSNALTYSTFLDNNWHQLAFTFDYTTNNFSVYMDGEVNGSKIVEPGLENVDLLGNTLGTYIGGGVAGRYFNGSLDDIMIFNRTLTKEQIFAFYNNQTRIVSQETSVDENWTVQIYPNDGAGDGLAKNSSITILDSISPLVTLELPVNQANMSSSTINFNWTVTDDKALTVTCNFTFDGVINQTSFSVTTGQTSNYTIENITEGGSHLWNLTCFDANANLNISATYNFSVDLTVPNVTLDTPLAWQNFSIQTVNFNFSVTDNISSYTTCDLYIDGAKNVSEMSVINGPTYNISVENIPDGTHNWNISCRDDANNTNMSISRNFTIDVSAPQVDYAVGTQPNGTRSNRNWIFVNVSITDATLFNITFNLYNATAFINSTNYSLSSNTVNVTFNWTNLDNTTYFYNVTVRDVLGNVNTTIVRTIYLDTEAPNVTLTAPASYSQDFDKVVTFAYKVNDTLSPVSNCTLFLNYTSNITNITIVQGVDQNFTVRQIPEWDNLTWYVTCYDNASNAGNSSVWFLDAYQNPTTSDSSSGDSGGGGGGGGAISAASSTVAYISEIVPDTPQSVTFTKEQHSIREIVLEVKENVENAQLRIQDLDSAPDDVDNLDNVYSYIEISVTNFDDNNLDSAEILFRVSKSWFEENDFDNEDIYLFRFTNKNWRQLKTSIDSDDDDYYYYKAETSGFSTFAIAVSETMLVGEEDVVDEDVEEEFVDNGEELTRFKFNFKEVNYWWYVGAGVLILLLVTGTILWLVLRKKELPSPKKKSKKQKK